MKIINLRKVNSGTLRAFFEIETPKMVIRGFKLQEGRDGNLYHMPPSREYIDKATGQKKWEDIIRIIDDDLKAKITELANAEYNRI